MNPINVSGLEVLPEEILYLKADANYTRFFLLDGKEIHSNFTLKIYEEKLNSLGFKRIHRSTLVNWSYVLLVNPEGVLLKTKKKLIGSRRKMKLITNQFM